MPRDLFADGPPSSAARAPRDLFMPDAPNSGAVAEPPTGLTPGSREYADWAAATARSGKTLPQVSPAPPAWPTDDSQDWQTPGEGEAGVPIVAQITRSLYPFERNAKTGAYRPAVPKIITGLGQSLQDAIFGPAQALSGEMNDIEVDPNTGHVLPFNSKMLDWAENTAGLVTGGETFPGRAALTDAAGRVVRAPVRRALAADKVPLDQVGPRVAAMGPDAVVADVGPNVRALAETGAALPGAGADRAIDAMAARRAAGPARIEAAANDVLGDAPTPSAMQADIGAGKRALGPDYEQALAGASPIDVSALAGGLDRQFGALRGKAKTSIQAVRQMLDKTVDPEEVAHANHELTQEWIASGREGPRPTYKLPLEDDPHVLFQVRQAIDGMLDGETDGNARRALTAARQQVDGLLAEAAPGLKAVDAKYADLARQGEAVDQGQTIFDTGRGAIRPAELDAKLADASPGVATRLSQGARAELDRIIGTNAHDRAALERLLRGDGDWNRRRLASVFGADKADQLLSILANEAAKAQTENGVLRSAGQRAAGSAKDALAPTPAGPGVVESALNLKPGTAVTKAADKTFGWATQMGRDRSREQIMDAIMGRGAWAAPVVQAPPIAAALAPMTGTNQNQRLRASAGDDLIRLIMRQ